MGSQDFLANVECWGLFDSIPGTSGWAGWEQTGTGWVNRGQTVIAGNCATQPGVKLFIDTEPTQPELQDLAGFQEGRDGHLSGQVQVA